MKTYSITLSDRSGTPLDRRAHILYNTNSIIVLQKGDCGSWVIDIESGEVFGHVVAADDFGEAYVIPFDSTTKEMSVDLGMDLVTIPTIKDIRIWCLTRRLQERKLYQNEIFPLIEEFTPPPDSGYSSLQSSPNF